MSHPKYTKIEDNAPDAEDPPPYSNPPDGPALPMGYRPGPPQYQPYHNLSGAEINNKPVVQSSQTIVITRVQSTDEPDYLAYSIFTMLCCCLPLGVAALVYSIQTQEANRVGNRIAARRNSRLARILAHTALGIGLGLLALYITFYVLKLTH
ncbi:hypothetical protein JD844_005674 [Phrynosoma platyrhinos]|uniref:Proline-rich transmembrane protein 1 n=1 Tax=Phrynosoma platyrhinos TaxID=52577 RepID=A0ABQ7TNL5_PHRPL|nr:hypothetical protein JD844_005674 [Phrynosoma platyrhinos]